MGFIKLIAEFGFEDESINRKAFNFVGNVFVGFYFYFIREFIGIPAFDLIKEYLEDITDLVSFIRFAIIKPVIKR